MHHNSFVAIVLIGFTVILTIYPTTSEACFLNDCMYGYSKRTFGSEAIKRECPACGSNGQCFGRNICCQQDGCTVGDSPDTVDCRFESELFDEPCVNSGNSCQSLPNGQCGSNGVCCSAIGCVADATCLTDDNMKKKRSMNDDFSQQLKRIARHLVDRR